MHGANLANFRPGTLGAAPQPLANQAVSGGAPASRVDEAVQGSHSSGLQNRLIRVGDGIPRNTTMSFGKKALGVFKIAIAALGIDVARSQIDYGLLASPLRELEEAPPPPVDTAPALIFAELPSPEFPPPPQGM